MDRVYFCIDMKSFFASVECAERGLDALTARLVVADESRTEKTICLAVSPALKAEGIKNRCRLFEIPKGTEFLIATPRMKKYIEYAAEIYAIYLKYIDKNDIHVYSIDECFIDATDYLKIYHMRAKDFAKKLMQEIWDKLHIPSTAGIGTNLYLAKIALDITAKHSPDRIGWLTEEKFVKTLSHHKPLSDFWGISHGTIARLARFGISDMEGIATCDQNLLYSEFGINAELLIDHAFGRETCTMADIKNHKTKSKSMSSSQILPCNYNFKDSKLILNEMLQSGCYELARAHFVTNLLHIFVGYGDSFSSAEGAELEVGRNLSGGKYHDGARWRGKDSSAKGTVRMHVTTNLFSQIAPYADKLFDSVVDRNRPIRRVGFDFGDLKSEELEQYDFFTDLQKVEEEKNLVSTLLSLQDKYGKNAVLKGVDLQEKATQKERNNMIGGHNSGEK